MDRYEMLTLEILANWRLSGVAVVLYEDVANGWLFRPITSYDSFLTSNKELAVPINEPLAFEAASEVEGIFFYVLKDNIVI